MESEIQKLNNAELIELFQKNNLGQFVDVIRQRGIDGKSLLEKTEFEIKILGGSEYKILWDAIQNMVKNSGSFLPHKKKIQRRHSVKVNVVNKQELENIFRTPALKPSMTSIEQNNDIEDENEYLDPVQIKTSNPDLKNKDINEELSIMALSNRESDGGYEPVPTFPKMRDRPLPDIPKVPIIIESPKIIEKKIKVPIEQLDDLYYQELIRNPKRNLAMSRPLPEPPIQLYINRSVEDDQERKARPKIKMPLQTIKRGPLPRPPTPVEDNPDIYENSGLAIKAKVGPFSAPPPKTDEKIYENPDEDYNPRRNPTINPNARRSRINFDNSQRKQFTPPIGASRTPLSRNIYPNDEIYENNEIDSRSPSRWRTASNNYRQDDSPSEIYENTETGTQRQPDNDVGEIYENNDINPGLKPAQKRRENYTVHVPSGIQGLPRPPIIRPVQEQISLLPDNLNDLKYFRNTDRVGAKRLLRDLVDGAFLFRKSSRYYVVLVVKHGDKFFNLGIIREGNKIKCDTNQYMSPAFNSFEEFISYFTTSPLTIKHDHEYTVFLKPVMPAYY